MKLAAIIRADNNANSDRATRQVQECLFDQLGPSLHSLRMAEPRLFGVACLKALDERPDALVVIGGNATARHAGEIAYQHKVPIAFLPSARPNAIARRLWGERSAETIIGLVARGQFAFARIDAGSASGRIFLSSAACGAVALAADRAANGMTTDMLSLLAHPRVSLRRRGVRAIRTAGLLASLSPNDQGPRAQRQFPKLQCWSLPEQGLAAMLRSAAKAARGRDWLADPADYFEAGEICIEGADSTWMVLDGEPMRIASIVRLQILPGAIQTMVPRVETQRSQDSVAEPRRIVRRVTVR